MIRILEEQQGLEPWGFLLALRGTLEQEGIRTEQKKIFGSLYLNRKPLSKFLKFFCKIIGTVNQIVSKYRKHVFQANKTD